MKALRHDHPGLWARAKTHAEIAERDLIIAADYTRQAREHLPFEFSGQAPMLAARSAHWARRAQRHATAALVLYRVAYLGNQGARMHSRRGA